MESPEQGAIMSTDPDKLIGCVLLVWIFAAVVIWACVFAENREDVERREYERLRRPQADDEDEGAGQGGAKGMRET
jgi:hypothetical protein